MSKQPYIPLYIGDWEQDVNGLSIEAEGAWLKIIFKCWRNEGSFTATPEIMARVCKVTPEKFVSILLEWEIGNICEITRHENGLLTLTNRRMKRDIEISAKRAVSGKKGMANRYQNDNKLSNKTVTNTQQNTEYEYDIDNESKKIEGVQGKKEEPEIDILSEESLSAIFNDRYLEPLPLAFPGVDILSELEKFKAKIRGAPEQYRHHQSSGISNAFLYQLRQIRPERKYATGKDKSTEHVIGLVEGFKRRHGSTSKG